MHGTHSGSKKLSTTQLPLRRERSNGVPSSSVPVASGAGRPSNGESDVSPRSVRHRRARRTTRRARRTRRARSTVRRAGVGAAPSSRRRPTRRGPSTDLVDRHTGTSTVRLEIRDRVIGVQRCRHRIDRAATPRAGERGEQRADRHDQATDPQPENHRLDEHPDRRRRVAGDRTGVERQVDVLGEPGADRRGPHVLADVQVGRGRRAVRVTAVEDDVRRQHALALAIVRALVDRREFERVPTPFDLARPPRAPAWPNG